MCMWRSLGLQSLHIDACVHTHYSQRHTPYLLYGNLLVGSIEIRTELEEILLKKTCVSSNFVLAI
jgi:hypothetical protein